ncbi:MAG TPA: DUF1588 domain-containing protein [Polyangiaceae bacterium]|nr:DUF1588 domain-containing protein [Polyangiaceae bacterium]
MTRRRWRQLLMIAALGWGAPACATQTPPAAPPSALIPARLRRLSNVEYERSANRLLGLDEPLRDELPPDERQDGYAINERQAVPSYFASELARVAERLAARAVSERLPSLLPCPAGAPSTSPCVERALARLAFSAFRRPPNSVERSALLSLFQRGARTPPAATTDARSEGLRVVLATLLSSPDMLYLSELGDDESRTDGVTTLAPYEIASSLAYAVTGAPPDAELLALAARPRPLLDGEVRARQARRLLSLSSTRHHFRQFVLEWLEVDQLERTAKAVSLVPNYDDVKSHMLAETSAFVDEVMVYGGASLASLLAARFTSPDATMAAYYGIPGFAGPRVSLVRQGRVGVFQHASFLSAHAHEDVTSPIKRGDFVLRRVLCVDLPRPGELGIDTTLPPRDERATTRGRFAAHTSSASCRSCHDRLDPLGFSFEGFDAAGRCRTREHEQPIVTNGELRLGGRELSFRDSAELATELSELPEARSCFAKQALRYLTGRRAPEMERWFAELVEALPSDRRESLLEWVVAWVKSPEFVLRRQAS